MTALPAAKTSRELHRSARPGARSRMKAKIISNLPAVESSLRAGESPIEIAKSLGIAPGYATRIVTHAAVALPVSPKALPGALPWKPQEDSYLLRERDENGTAWLVLEILLERPRGELILRYGYLKRVEARREVRGQCIPLNCMTCGEGFISSNKKTNRRCDKCRADCDGLPEAFLCYDPTSAQATRSSHSA